MKTVLVCLLVLLVGTTGLSGQESVADAARRLKREKESEAKSATKAKRVYTDDDVSHSTDEPPPLSDTPSSKEKVTAYLEQAEALADGLQRKTERQLADEAVGETAFPGREAWEGKLLAQKDRLVDAIRAAIGANREFGRAIDSGDPVRIKGEREITQEKLSNLRFQRFQYDQLVAEGQKAAAKWKEDRDK